MIKGEGGYSFIEFLVAVMLLSIVGTAGFMLLVSGESAWSITDTRIHLQQNLRQIMQRTSTELQESGEDNNGVLQVSILDNQGVNNTDILRFSVPLCVCGISAIDSNGEVRYWGAPLVWGQAGCSTNYVVDQNNKVTICHVPPGNPNNTQTLSVSINSVGAHLTHGDWIGDCNGCSPANYTNRTIEYLLDNSGQLLRRVLNTNNGVINSVLLGQGVVGFQVSLNASQTVVALTAQLSQKAIANRLITVNGSWNVLLRNKD